MKQIIGAIALLCLWLGQGSANPDYWRHEGSKTDFSQHPVPLSDTLSGGPHAVVFRRSTIQASSPSAKFKGSRRQSP